MHFCNVKDDILTENVLKTLKESIKSNSNKRKKNENESNGNSNKKKPSKNVQY